MRRAPLFAALLAPLALWAVTSCGIVGPTGCTGVGYNALEVTIRDIYGKPAALGSTVTLYDGDYTEANTSPNDPLNISAAKERGGRTYDIRVSRPFYNDAWLRGIKTKGGGCVRGGDDVLTTVGVTLTPIAGAPAVRAVRLAPPHILIDRAPYNGVAQFTPYLDADPTVTSDIIWRITGDTTSVSWDPTTGRATYRCRAVSGYLTITAISRADTTVRTSGDLAVQGHPAVPSDPAC